MWIRIYHSIDEAIYALSKNRRLKMENAEITYKYFGRIEFLHNSETGVIWWKRSILKGHTQSWGN